MQEDLFKNGLAITPALRSTLTQIAKWCRVLVMITYATQLLSFMINLKDTNAIYTFITFAVGIAFNTLLYIFANKLLIALNNNSEETLAQSLNNLRLYFLILGILIIIVSVFLIVAMCWLLMFMQHRF